MLVILTDEQVLSPKQVCQGCLFANQEGLPRWRKNGLGCGLAMQAADKRVCPKSLTQVQARFPKLYQCQMGFQVAYIEG
ncbi:hypothetical protein PN462_18785 [Spirulina sp. CS-785/01]|uniref:hypothetical protein n=1 Tax=Spirulina sp. CS-785/01 TaxID=3021716 RepID=UPI00232AA241|nr:hypothetical protein [Spirulina sp. CS-785/01]MDB9315168.1 hypothetical protein [Spirulina sp. CS-785/01]